MEKATLEYIGDIDFTCALLPNINFVTSKQNWTQKIDQKQ